MIMTHELENLIRFWFVSQWLNTTELDTIRFCFKSQVFAWWFNWIFYKVINNTTIRYLVIPVFYSIILLYEKMTLRLEKLLNLLWYMIYDNKEWSMESFLNARNPMRYVTNSVQYHDDVDVHQLIRLIILASRWSKNLFK